MTVNNKYHNFDMDRFALVDQLIKKEEYAGFNPQGTGAFSFQACSITSVCPTDGPCVTEHPLVGKPFQTATGHSTGKMADVDVEVETHATVLYGLTLGLDLHGARPFCGRLRSSPVADVWRNIWDIGGLPFGGQFSQGAFQSVLEDVEWDEKSPFLTSGDSYQEVLHQMYMKSVHEGHVLSVKFNLDHYQELNSSHPHFTFGRVSGTIGLAKPNDALHFVRSRLLQSFKVPNDPESRTYAIVAPFQVNAKTGHVTFDLGNALMRQNFDGDWNNQYLGDSLNFVTKQTKQHIGSIDISTAGSYLQHASVFDIRLTSDLLKTIQEELVEVFTDAGTLVMSEVEKVIRPVDHTFAKLNPGDTWSVEFFVTNLGKSVCGFSTEIQVTLGSTQTPADKVEQALNALRIINGRDIGEKHTKLFTTDCRGRFTVTLTASHPGNPRGFVDGEIYQVAFLPKSQNPGVEYLLVRVYDEANMVWTEWSRADFQTV